MIRKSELIQEIIKKRTLVYENKGTRVYVSRKRNRANLKEDVEIRVISPEGLVSKMFDVTMKTELDPVKAFKEILGCSGLSVNDIKKISKNIQLKHDEIKVSVSEEESLEDMLGLFYEILEEKKKTIEEIKGEDENLDETVLLKDGYYMFKTGVFKRITDEMEVKSSEFRKELVSLGFIEIGSGRDSVSVSVNSKKHKLIRVRRDLMKRIFESVDIEEEVIG